MPQVFVEHNCTPVQALEFTCQKAGLHNDAWKDDEVEIQKFQSQVFKEEEPHGKIIEVM